MSAQCGVHYCGFRSRKGAHRFPSFLRCVSNLINSLLPLHSPPGALRCHPAYSNLFFLFPGFPQEQHPFRCVEATGFLVNYCVCTFLNMPASSHVLQGREVFPIHTPKRLVPLFSSSSSKVSAFVQSREKRRDSGCLRGDASPLFSELALVVWGLSQFIFIFVELAFQCFPDSPH